MAKIKTVFYKKRPFFSEKDITNGTMNKPKIKAITVPITFASDN